MPPGAAPRLQESAGRPRFSMNLEDFRHGPLGFLGYESKTFLGICYDSDLLGDHATINGISMGYQWDITKNGVVLLPKRWEFVGPAIYTRCGALDERASFSGLINFTSWNGHIPKCLVIYKIYKCD